jgi:hypothetical protein
MVEAERGQHQVETAVAERQRDRVGHHREPAVAAPQHALRQIGPHHLACARGQRGPSSHARPRPQVEHQAAGQRHRGGRH